MQWNLVSSLVSRTTWHVLDLELLDVKSLALHGQLEAKSLAFYMYVVPSH